MASKISGERPLLLASGSPRRREMLTQLGVPLLVDALDVDEAVLRGEAPDAYLERVVAAKEWAALGLAAARGTVAAVLVADTVVVHGGRILGKPRDDEDARAMVSALAGDEHTVSTRYVIAVPGAQAEAAPAARAAKTVTTAVWFRPLSRAQVDAYVASGEGRDKAGAYAIQGLGAMLVPRIEGDYANVVGLPICHVVLSLEELGLL